MFPSLRPRTKYLSLTLFLLITTYLLFTRIAHLTHSHLYDLSYDSLFTHQYNVYILTSSCDRFAPEIVSQFSSDPASVYLVPNTHSIPACDTLTTSKQASAQLHTDTTTLEDNGRTASADDIYRLKYLTVLSHCQASPKSKCLILEDDIIFLHDPARTRSVLIENTLPLFNDGERDAFDCTKRGFGWLGTSHTGMGSQCRVYSSWAAECLRGCLGGPEGGVQVDTGLRNCQVRCGLKQKRFLLVVHGGLGSTMGREGKKEKREWEKETEKLELGDVGCDS